jgi:hypothetical protein
MKKFSWITFFILGLDKKDYVSQLNRQSSPNNSATLTPLLFDSEEKFSDEDDDLANKRYWKIK